MKNIIGQGLQLLSMFLVLVASSMMFLSSPAVTAPSSIDMDAINKQENQILKSAPSSIDIDAINKQEDQILKSDKPVKASKPDEATVILAPEEAVRQANTSAKKRESFPKGFFNKSKTAKDKVPSSK
jgi:hypothetical protein